MRIALALAAAGALLDATALLNAQQRRAAPALVFDHVTVVDVEQGRLVPGQRVVIVGRRIQALGDASAVALPKGARVVEADGKYLIPGLWDMHIHPALSTSIFYPLFFANGILGVRDAGSPVPLDTLRRWRREIVAGTRPGPPVQILSGSSITDIGKQYSGIAVCNRAQLRRLGTFQACITDSADARHYVDSLRAAGADMIKPRDVGREMYFVIAAEARRDGIPFGGHVMARSGTTTREAADSGARIIDHEWGGQECGSYQGSVDACRQLVDYLRPRETWFVPTMLLNAGGPGTRSGAVKRRLEEAADSLWAGHPLVGNWLHRTLTAPAGTGRDTAGAGTLAIAEAAGVPILAGTDVAGTHSEFGRLEQGGWDKMPPGLSLHAELAVLVAEGLSPLTVLRSATLNPARMFHATDSLGAVAPGKLADLVLLDADPLADITNTTAIRAVVANGRYYDRAALDRVIRGVRDARAGLPRVTVDHPAVTLSTVAPYNTLRLKVTPRDTLGRPIAGLPAPTFASLDTAKLQVTAGGVLTARQPGTGIRVVVGLAHRPMALADTLRVDVTTAAPPPKLASFSIHPVPPDSAVWSMESDFFGMWLLRRPGIGFGGQFVVTPVMRGQSGATIEKLPVEYTSLDPAVATVNRWTGEVTLNRPGTVRMAARTTAYGVSRADTATFKVTLPLSRQFAIQAGPGGKPVFDSRDTNEVRIAPGGIVFWTNALPDTVDVTFDDPVPVQSPPPALCDTIPSMFQHMRPDAYCGAGNALVPPPADTGVVASFPTLRARRFPKPGVYPFHSTRTGAAGRIVVTERGD